MSRVSIVMKTHISKRGGVKLVVIVGACLLLAGFAWSDRRDRLDRVDGSSMTEENIVTAADPAKAKAAFNEAAKVFFSARCANCHPASDTPTQGDEMVPHTMGVTRGEEGRGVYGQKCTTCHQNENLAGEHMPPGTSKDWHMPPANQKMVFQGLTPRQLCMNFKDPSKNGGHKTLAAAMEHVQKKDPLVIWAWDPGNGRTVPPMSFDAFAAKVQEWVDNGGVCPD
jgi:cytochrome c5